MPVCVVGSYEGETRSPLKYVFPGRVSVLTPTVKENKYIPVIIVMCNSDDSGAEIFLKRELPGFDKSEYSDPAVLIEKCQTSDAAVELDGEHPTFVADFKQSSSQTLRIALTHMMIMRSS